MNTARLLSKNHRLPFKSPVRFHSAVPAKVQFQKRILSYLLFTLGVTLLLHISPSEPLANSERLQDEILSKEPNDILVEISGNNGEGCKIYVIDQGHLSNELKDRCIYYDLFRVASSSPFDSHGNKVVSILAGEEGLAKTAHIHYYGIMNEHICLPFAFLKVAYDAEAPGVVTCSLAAVMSSHDHLARAEPLYRLLMNISIAIITAKGIPVIVCAANGGTDVFPASSLPTSCKRVWAIGNLENDEWGEWQVQEDSNRGGWVKYYAPGTNIPVQKYYPLIGLTDSGPATGTSFSTPAVAAIIARLQTRYPWMCKADIEATLDKISVLEQDQDHHVYRRIPLPKSSKDSE